MFPMIFWGLKIWTVSRNWLLNCVCAFRIWNFTAWTNMNSLLNIFFLLPGNPQQRGYSEGSSILSFVHPSGGGGCHRSSMKLLSGNSGLRWFCYSSYYFSGIVMDSLFVWSFNYVTVTIMPTASGFFERFKDIHTLTLDFVALES